LELRSWLFGHRKKTAKARSPSKTPINGLETANHKEMFQPGAWEVEFVFTLFFSSVRRSIFQKSDIFLADRVSAGQARRLFSPQDFDVSVNPMTLRAAALNRMATNCHLSQSTDRSDPVILLFADMARQNAHRR
jgi:hypothetical protein